MIKCINGASVNCASKDPRRKAQSIKFRNNPDVSVNIENKQKNYESQQRKAIRTSMLVVLGSVIFTFGYFMLLSLKKIKC